ncbi:MAG TPA: energy transducer TonB [Candidatus Acidoferrales bacterium]|jgi:outer membrane biosynthesis protein TonB|nr:energy transducer TonB [Candidatus Acidoferrales bacterium]
MADSAHIAQVVAREIPVTIQGSQIIDGTDRRELFTETTKTTLTFDNGAAVNLKARVAQGQSLFLRNELSGREILCRVIESPPAGETGCTDLEFTIHDPDFWNVQREHGAAPAEIPEEPQDAPSTPSTAMAAEAAPPMESATAAENAPAVESATVAENAASSEGGAPTPSAEPSPGVASAEEAGTSTVPKNQEIPGLSALLGHGEAPPEAASVSHVDDAKDAEQLAGIVAKYARALAKRASAKSAEKEAEQAAAEDATSDDGIPVPATKKAFSNLAFRWHAIRELTVRNNTISLAIVACIVIGGALGVAWDVTGMLYPGSRQPLAALARMPHSPSHPKPASAKAAGQAKTGKSALAQQAPKIQPPAVSQVPAVKMAKTPAATVEAAPSTRSSKAIEDSGMLTSKMEESRNGLDAEPTNDDKARKHEPSVPELIPAKIVSQYQPSLPPWAKDLDLQGVVKLDAVIDDKGNLKTMKVLSGPRALESAAEGAVGLWLFEPATLNGKPTTTHMTLTVEFQR